VWGDEHAAVGRAAAVGGNDRAGVRATDGQAADESEEAEVEEGEAGTTADPVATDEEYIEAPVDGGEQQTEDN
jgi:DNA-directed RNA polymerase subunit beta